VVLREYLPITLSSRVVVEAEVGAVAALVVLEMLMHLP
jgi:hypothetical protein